MAKVNNQPKLIDSASAFNTTLAQIRATGAKLDALIFSAACYCSEQSVAHGNHAPWKKLVEAAPSYARTIVRNAEKVARATRADKIKAPAIATELAAEQVAQPLAKRQKEKAAKAAEAKATKTTKTVKSEKAAPQKPELPVVKGARLVSPDGHAQDLSTEEYAILAAYLNEIRTKGRVAAVA